MEHGNYEVTLKHCHVQSLGWVHPLDCLGKKRQPILGTILQMCCSLENPGPGRRLCLSRDRGMQTLLWQSGGLCPSCAPQAKQPIVQDRLLFSTFRLHRGLTDSSPVSPRPPTLVMASVQAQLYSLDFNHSLLPDLPTVSLPGPITFLPWEAIRSLAPKHWADAVNCLP